MGRKKLWICLTVLLAAIVQSSASAAADAVADIQLRPITYRELGEAIKAFHGKVVVVDVWAEYCVPCKREFPKLLAMRRKYVDDGLVCLTVSVDEASKHEAALGFLKKQHADTINYRLTEKPEFWQQKWRISGVPAVFVFNRDGKRAHQFDAENDKHVDYDVIEVEVRKLLGKGN